MKCGCKSGLSPADLNLDGLLQRATATTDTHGGRSETWATYARVKVNVIPIPGREVLGVTQVTAVLQSRVRLWWRSDVSVRDRLVVESRTLQIESAFDPDGRKDELRMICTEVQS